MKASAANLASIPRKSIAVIVSMIAMALATASFMGIAYFISAGFYSQENWDYYRSGSISRLNHINASEIAEEYYVYLTRYESLLDQKESLTSIGRSTDTVDAEIKTIYPLLHAEKVTFDPNSTNLRFVVTTSDGKIVLSTYEGESFGIHEAYEFEVDVPEYVLKETVEVDCYVLNPFNVVDEYAQDAWQYRSLYKARYGGIAVCILSALVMIISTIYLVSAAGYKETDGKVEIVQGGLHLLPLDILYGLIAVAFIIVVAVRGGVLNWGTEVFNIDLTSESLLFNIVVTSLTTMVLWGLVLFAIMSTAIRFKTHTFPNTFWVLTLGDLVKNQTKDFYSNRQMSGRTLIWAVILGVVTIGAGYFIVDRRRYVFFVLLVLAVMILAMVLLNQYYKQQERLKERIHRLAEGEIVGHIDTRDMNGIFKDEAEDLNRIDEVIQNSINEQIKSERMKTELITNVSHDIKTPLTSIINYVDLLKRENPEEYNERQKQYLSVLENESIRMKKLIEDLIEASKATTGNINVELAELDLREMVEQISGEYEEHLQQNGLRLVTTLPKAEVPVTTDGQLLWRIMENLLSNAQKYSQRGTRVYLDLSTGGEEDKAVITLRNVSNYELNISAEELQDRFVRGDLSRHTEGSGLGLSIARSLAELIGARFEIKLDGDLFKAIVRFPKDTPETDPNEKPTGPKPKSKENQSQTLDNTDTRGYNN